MIRIIIFLLSGICAFSYHQLNTRMDKKVRPGAYQLDEYLPLLKGKHVGLTINHSSFIGNVHLVDTLQSLGVSVSKVFTPEHGFTGTVSDGVNIAYDNSSTPFELISLYGKNKKPSPRHLAGLEAMVFDIQDVGARFYTYISTLHYVMEACAENNVPLIILDRPNPNGSYVDGPVLDAAFQSFVGMHPIPIVHGMTIAELAQMIKGEGWLSGERNVDLTVIKIKNWDHKTPYSLPVKPSPNLPDDLSISLYPSLCLFEGTIMSVGRGTDHAFQQIGHPEYPEQSHSFTPVSRKGAKRPLYEGSVCYGKSWTGQKKQYRFTLQPLIEGYQKMNRPDFFNTYFEKLAGSGILQKQIEKGMSEAEIRGTWKESLNQFKQKRITYLLYN